MATPFPRLPHPNLGGRSLLRKALVCPPKLLLQPERYAKYEPNGFECIYLKLYWKNGS